MPFTASIIDRDFAYVPSKALLLSGASYLRSLRCGGSWARIRIGALVSLTPYGTNHISNKVLTIGLCSGKTRPGSSMQPLSALGFSVVGSPVAGSSRSLTYAANSNYPYYSPTSGVMFRNTYPVGLQVSSAAGSLFIPPSYAGAIRRRFPIYLDITRNFGGGGALVMTAYGVATGANAQLDFRPDHFQGGLDQTGIPVVNNATLTTATTTITTFGVGDELGPLDTFELFWSGSTLPLEVHAVGAVVINPAINTSADTYYPSTAAGGLDLFGQYTPDTQVTDLSYGTGYSGNGTIYGWSSGTTFVNMAGTSGGVPVDTFEQYFTGSVVSGVTLNAGTGWSSYGTIY